MAESKNVKQPVVELVLPRATTAEKPAGQITMIGSFARLPDWWSSLPCETDDDKMAMLTLADMRQHDADKFAGGIRVSNLVRMPYEFDDDAGEHHTIPRYIAQDVDGNWYNLFGSGIVGDIDRLVAVVKSPPFSPPIIFTLLCLDVGKPSPLKKMTFKNG